MYGRSWSRLVLGILGFPSTAPPTLEHAPQAELRGIKGMLCVHVFERVLCFRRHLLESLFLAKQKGAVNCFSKFACAWSVIPCCVCIQIFTLCFSPFSLLSFSYFHTIPISLSLLSLLPFFSFLLSLSHIQTRAHVLWLL